MVSRIGQSEEGTSTAEFVIVLFLLVTILFSILEFGTMMNAYLVVSTAAREGARRAAIEGGRTAEVLASIEHQLALGNLLPDHAEITISPKEAAYGRPISVRVAYPYRPRFGFVTALSGGIIWLDAEVMTRSEKVR